MKIPSDLRQAITSVCEAQNTTGKNQDLENAAIQQWARKHPKIRKLVQRKLSFILRINTIDAELEQFGVYASGTNQRVQINNRKRAEAAGFSFASPPRIYFHHVIAELAQANKQDASAILKRLGIVWE